MKIMSKKITSRPPILLLMINKEKFLLKLKSILRFLKFLDIQNFLIREFSKIIPH